jgi:hypothetical protein
LCKFRQDELTTDEAAEGFGLVDLAVEGAALMQSEDKEVLGLGLHAVGQDEGLSDSVGTVDLLEDVGEGFRALEFDHFSLFLLAGE